MKYLGTLDHPIPNMILESVQKGNHLIIEIDPKFFSTWDFRKMYESKLDLVVEQHDVSTILGPEIHSNLEYVSSFGYLIH